MVVTEFDKQFKAFIIEWMQIKNNLFSNFYIDPNEFYSEVINKLYYKKGKDNKANIEKFNKNHISQKNKKVYNTSFKAWLGMVLNNLHIDLYRKKRFLSLEEIQDNKGDSFHPEHYDNESNNFEENLSEQVSNIYKKIETVSKVKYRVLLKLKLYIEGYITFNDEELEYIALHSSFSNEEIMKFIDRNKKNEFGLKTKHITILTEFNEGSITTLYKRVVRKLEIKT